MALTYSPVLHGQATALATLLAERMSAPRISDGANPVPSASASDAFLIAFADALLLAFGPLGQHTQNGYDAATSSTSFVDVFGIWNFTSHVANTRVFHVDVSAINHAASTWGVLEFAVVVNGTEYRNDACRLVFDTTNTRENGSFRVVAPVVAGANTVRLRWRVGASGGSMNVLINAFDFLTITA